MCPSFLLPLLFISRLWSSFMLWHHCANHTETLMTLNHVTDETEASRLPTYGQRKSSACSSFSFPYLPPHQKETPVSVHTHTRKKNISVRSSQYKCIVTVCPAGWTQRSGWPQWRCCCPRAVRRVSGWCSTWLGQRDERSPSECTPFPELSWCMLIVYSYQTEG